MSELQSAQRRSFTAKAIFGLLLAVVMVGAFATPGSAENTGNPRWGWLHVTKECSQYSGLPGGFCTITGSNLNAIQPGMKVIYASAPDFTALTLNSDLVLDGPGQNDAYGHVKLSLQTFTGPLTFSGGTGQFQRVPRDPVGRLQARRQPLYVGRTVLLHPLRPRQISAQELDDRVRKAPASAGALSRRRVDQAVGSAAAKARSAVVSWFCERARSNLQSGRR